MRRSVGSFCRNDGLMTPTTRKVLMLFIGVVGAIWLFGASNLSNVIAVGDSIERALSFGAAVKIPFKVVDETGAPVSGAEISVGMWLWTVDENGVDGMTDRDGIFIASGQSADEIIYSISKDGYYRTSGKFRLSQEPDAAVKGGKWMPYGKERQVILKRRIKPIPMFAVRKTFYLPELGRSYGFDTLEMDLVKPFGKGEHTDIYVTYKGDREDRESLGEFHLEWADKDCGFYETDYSDSKLFSPHHADTNRTLTTTVTLVTTRDFRLAGRWVDPMEGRCFVFRVRPKYSPEGKLIAIRYGKMYGPIHCHYTDWNGSAAEFEFVLYANPTENDTNLEFLPYHSLNYPDGRSKQPNILP